MRWRINYCKQKHSFHFLEACVKNNFYNFHFLLNWYSVVYFIIIYAYSWIQLVIQYAKKQWKIYESLSYDKVYKKSSLDQSTVFLDEVKWIVLLNDIIIYIYHTYVLNIIKSEFIKKCRQIYLIYIFLAWLFPFIQLYKMNLYLSFSSQ